MSTPVLFDVQGPRARRNTWIFSGVAVLALVAVLLLVLQRLSERGQLDAEKWAPLFDPRDETFPVVWEVMGRAGLRNLQAAAWAMTFSVALGTVLALTRVTARAGLRWPVVGFIELFRGIPVVIAIFFAARVLPEVGIDLSAMWYLVIGLTAYNSVVIAEIIRSGLAAVPHGQLEAAYAVGLTRGQALRIVLLPQGVRIMLPALISQLIVVLKDTSLGFIIPGFEELVRTSGRVGQQLDNPLQAFLLGGLLFIVANLLLGRLAEYVQRRMSRTTQSHAADDDTADGAPARIPVGASDATTGA